MSLSSRLSHFRLAHGLFWRGNTPPIPWAFLFKTAAFVAVSVLAVVATELNAKLDVMERVTEIYEAKVTAMTNCEKGAQAYYYPDGRAFECPKPL